jgi:hypothetical protein
LETPLLQLQRRNGQNRAQTYRIEQITKQLSAKSGLTNRKRKELDRERNFLKRLSAPESPSPPSEKDERKMKAAGKKLRWLGRKADRAKAPN